MENTAKLFDRLGGAAGLAEIVGDMYARVVQDPELAPFFQNVPMDRLRKMQFQFLASAFDGPVQYSGAELTAIHKGHGIKTKHFSKFCNHFAAALENRGVAANDVNDALGRLAIFKDKITGEANTDG